MDLPPHRSLAGAFLLASAVATRFGDASIGAHQIAIQLFFFLALVLDSIAIANQIIVGRELGAGRLDDAYAAGARMIALSTAVGAAFAAVLLVSADVIPRAFTSDAEVLAEAAVLWPLFALAQPLAGAVFALDGILIGAGDGPFLAASMLLAFLCCGAVLLASLEWDWGMRGVWAALLDADLRAARSDVAPLPAPPLARHGLDVSGAALLRRQEARLPSACASSARARGTSARAARPGRGHPRRPSRSPRCRRARRP